MIVNRVDRDRLFWDFSLPPHQLHYTPGHTFKMTEHNDLAIGSTAIAKWPNLIGEPIDVAVAKIELDRPDLLLVAATKEVWGP